MEDNQTKAATTTPPIGPPLPEAVSTPVEEKIPDILSAVLPEKTIAESPPHKTGSKKGILIAGVVIFIIALVAPFAYYIIQNNTVVEENLVAVAPAIPMPQNSPTPTPQVMFLTLTSPTEEQLITNNSVFVQGSTLPGSSVIIYTDDEETVVDADSMGVFSATIELVEGINSLTITSFSLQGEEKSLDINIVRDVNE